jgi:hypothetical protein
LDSNYRVCWTGSRNTVHSHRRRPDLREYDRALHSRPLGGQLIRTCILRVNLVMTAQGVFGEQANEVKEFVLRCELIHRVNNAIALPSVSLTQTTRPVLRRVAY